MSWLSKLTGTEGKTPSWLKKAGNVVGGAVVNAVPFGLGTAVDKVLNVSGSQPPGSGGLQQLVSQTGRNLEGQMNTAINTANTMNQINSQLPVLAGIALIAFLILNQREG